MKDFIEDYLGPILVVAILAATLLGFSWIVSDYTIRSETLEANVRKACIDAGGNPIRQYGGAHQCVNPHQR
jgi:hypothetical protein